LSRYTICSNPECPYIGALQEDRGWNPVLNAEPCPFCKSALVSYCPACFLSLSQPPDLRDPRCARCKSLLKPAANGKTGESSS
jgi:hypothetical protein